MREPSKKFKPLFTQETPIEVEQMGLTWLVAAAIVTAIMWQIPIGNYILYPFSILATWFHDTAGSLGLSDTGQMQRYLFLPYWFWGLLMAIASLVILVQSLRVVYSTNQQ